MEQARSKTSDKTRQRQFYNNLAVLIYFICDWTVKNVMLFQSDFRIRTLYGYNRKFTSKTYKKGLLLLITAVCSCTCTAL